MSEKQINKWMPLLIKFWEGLNHEFELTFLGPTEGTPPKVVRRPGKPLTPNVVYVKYRMSLMVVSV